MQTLLDVQSACDEGDIRAFATINMLKRLGCLSKPALAVAKRMIRARFGNRFPPHLLSRAIRSEREKFLHAERAKAFGSKAASSLSSKFLCKKDRLAVAFGRRGGLTRGRKGLAAMTPEKRAEIQAKAIAGIKRARAQREAARGMAGE
jgi:hypothetical protein